MPINQSKKRTKLLLEAAIERHKNGQLVAANLIYQEIRKSEPNNIDVLNLSGVLSSQIGQHDIALNLLSKAIDIDPGFAEAFNNRGAVLKELEQLKEALKHYNKALSLNPNYSDALNNRGNVLRDFDRFDESLCDLNKAIALKPDFAQAYNNRGVTLGHLRQFEQSFNDFNKAISLKPDYAEAFQNISSFSLLLCDFKEGWPLYEWRWIGQNEAWSKKGRTISPLSSSKPLWDGETGKRIFLWAEQGIGDEIMFSSMLREVYAASSQLIVQCDQRLIPLFKRSFNDDIIYNHNRDEISEDAYDFHIPIGSLPRIFRPSLESFKKGSKPFLRFELNKASSLRQKILTDPEERLIGISWKSKSILPGSLKRNISLNDIVHYTHTPKTKLLSLQYGDVSKEIMQLKKETGIDIIQIDEIDNYADIDGLATIIGACDQVVSIDNATVHLAGALGADTRVLLPYNRDWRWGVSGTTSYWYDTIRLYRQSKPNDWETTLKILRDELEADSDPNTKEFSKAMA